MRTLTLALSLGVIAGAGAQSQRGGGLPANVCAGGMMAGKDDKETDRREHLDQIGKSCKEPQASLARSNLANLLIVDEKYKEAADLADKIVLPKPGSPEDQQITIIDRIRLQQTRARAFDYADRQGKAIDAYYDVLREGANPMDTQEELLFCTERFLQRGGSSQELFPLAVELEIRSREGLGQKLFRELWDEFSGSPQSADLRAELEPLILRLYAAYPPSAVPFRDKKALSKRLNPKTCAKSLLCDVALAFCGSKYCGEKSFDWRPFTTERQVAAAFPAAAALHRPADERFGLRPKSSPEAVDDGVAREAFAELVGRLAATRSAERSTEKALALSTVAWLLDPGATRSALLTASLIEPPSPLDSDGSVRKALLEQYKPSKLRIDTLRGGSGTTRERLQAADTRDILRVYEKLDAAERANRILRGRIEEVRSARKNSVISPPTEGDRFVDGWIDPNEDSLPLVRVSVNPPGCLENEATGSATLAWQRQERFTVASGEGFFSAPLDEPLVGGESISIWTEKRPKLVEKEPVRLAGLGLGGLRIYTRVGFDVSGALPKVNFKRPYPAAAVTFDWALRAPRVRHPACTSHPKDYVSVHTYADLRLLERVGFTRGRESEAESGLFNKREPGGTAELGFYVPMRIPRTQWRYRGRAFSHFIAPLVKTGVQVPFRLHSDRIVRGRVQPFYAVGFRWGIHRYPTYSKGSKSGSEKLLTHLDVTRGQWRNFSAPAQTDAGRRFTTPWRMEIRFNAAIPRIKRFGPRLFVSGRYNFGGGLPFDYQLFIGWRHELRRK